MPLPVLKELCPAEPAAALIKCLPLPEACSLKPSGCSLPS
jgi:hypothetical protein